MSAARSNSRTDGCWTCKLRRKKCDQSRPKCDNCNSLEIACNYGPKPAWMDGRERQRQMADSLKSEIKRNAAYRREKANTSSGVGHEAATHQFNVISDMMVSSSLLSTEPMDSEEQLPAPDRKPATSQGDPPFPLLPYNLQEHRCSGIMKQSPPIETEFTMKYLDFVFPFLFPFYRPTLFETGRSWLLLLLEKSKIAYHSTVSLSCYFFTMALTDADSGGEHSECKHLPWEGVEEQTKKCFDSIRTEIVALNLGSGDTKTTRLERVEIMESVMQVLIFEIALGKSAPWDSHLPPAFTLFEEIMAIPSPSHPDQAHSKFTSVLMEIGKPVWTLSGPNRHIWSPDQAGFRFCAGLLIFVDVVASTATQTTPRLWKYHAEVLAQVDEGTYAVSDAEIRLSSIVGCRNWVIRAIAEISALESWKREQIGANSLSVVEVVDRASRIAGGLRDGIMGIRDTPFESLPPTSGNLGPFEMRPSPSASSKSTLIWACAAQLYLTVVVSGWQLSNTDVRTNVAQIIALLQTVPAYQLRALAWPLCVAGCLALESEEPLFTALFSTQGRIYTAGTLDDARQILEKVWQVRSTLQAGAWNLASCFSILGSPILLA